MIGRWLSIASFLRREKAATITLLTPESAITWVMGFDGLEHQNCAQTKFVKNRQNPITYVMPFPFLPLTASIQF